MSRSSEYTEFLLKKNISIRISVSCYCYHHIVVSFFENEVFKQTNAFNHQYFGSDFLLLHTRFCHRLCSVAFSLPV